MEDQQTISLISASQLNKIKEKHLYFSRYAEKQLHLKNWPKASLGMSVVIPCHRETALIKTLDSLYQCSKPNKTVEVIIVINSSERADDNTLDINDKALNEAQKWIQEHPSDFIDFHIIEATSLPKKHAGVGLARKIGMDEAALRFELLEKEGIIVCFDADSLCDTNYLVEIERHFETNYQTPGCSIYYEHPLQGELEKAIYEGITNYELHLRYYVHALKYAGFIHAHQTIGSSMAVRSRIYQKQGGMNKRKAGEDFYFLHKIIPLGNFTELNTTRVIPSPRRSDRVPFGTGKAINDWLANTDQPYTTYNLKSFEELKVFLINIDFLRKIEKVNQYIDTLPPAIKGFLKQEKFDGILPEIQRHGKTKEAFTKRFFQWFDGFKAMKYVHYARDNYYPDTEITSAAQALCKIYHDSSVKKDATALLLKYRIYDQKN